MSKPLPKFKLRDVVDVVVRSNGTTLELLSCGHRKSGRKDWYGTIDVNSVTRRCYTCAQELRDSQGESSDA